MRAVADIIGIAGAYFMFKYPFKTGMLFGAVLMFIALVVAEVYKDPQ